MYSQLAVELTRRIVAGDFPIGSFLPPEVILCEEYGVSRHTMRQALGVLSNEGYIKRTSGLGTLVLATSPKARVEQWSTLSDLLALYRGSRQKIVSMEDMRQLDDFLLGELSIKDTQGWLKVGIHRSERDDTSPYAVAQLHFARQYAGIIHKKISVGDEAPFRRPYYELIEKTYGVVATSLDQSITAVPAPAPVAAALGIKRGAPSLRVVRTYRDSERRCIEISSTHFGERFSYRTTLDLDSALQS